MTINKLDLGGTACYESKEAVNICLDSSSSDDEIVQNLIGDYNFMPFKSNSFDEAFGSCYLETPYNPEELYRVMKSGGVVTVKACTISGPEAHMLTLYLFRKAGFVVLEDNLPYEETYGEDKSSDWTYDAPVVFQKPKGG